MRNTERLYTSLLFDASRKYAAWDPEIPVKVGDYGIISAGRPTWGFRSIFSRNRPRSRGVFVKEGNVYKEGIAEKLCLPAPKKFGGGSHGDTWVTSTSAKEISVEAAAGGDTPVMVSCNIKAAFEFTSKKGAVLVMHNDSITTVQPPAKLRFLFDEPKLRGKVIVSEVHRCSSYARFVATDKTSSIALGLSVSAPKPVKGLVTDIETGVEEKWVRSTSTGNFKTRTRKDKKKKYYPLFRLVSLDERGLGVGLRGGEGGDPPLPDALPPWMEGGENEEEDKGEEEDKDEEEDRDEEEGEGEGEEEGEYEEEGEGEEEEEDADEEEDIVSHVSESSDRESELESEPPELKQNKPHV